MSETRWLTFKDHPVLTKTKKRRNIRMHRDACKLFKTSNIEMHVFVVSLFSSLQPSRSDQRSKTLAGRE